MVFIPVVVLFLNITTTTVDAYHAAQLLLLLVLFLLSFFFVFFKKHLFVFVDCVMQRTAALSCLAFTMLLLHVCVDIEHPAQLVYLTQKQYFGKGEKSRGKQSTK